MSATVLESFGQDLQLFKCAMCTEERSYFDLLSDGRKVCLECSVKGKFELDVHAAVHQRSPDLMMTDPELIQIRNKLVQWELETSSVELDKVLVPREVAVRLLEICEAQGVSLDVVSTVAFRMLISAYDRPDFENNETQPALPEELVS